MNCSIALSLVGVVALVSSASAADIYSSGGGLKDIPVLIPVNTWAGFYFGLNGGYGWNADNNNIRILDTATATVFDRFAGADPSGGFGGGQIGYNWQWDRFVFGIEGDLQGAGISGSTTTFSTPLEGAFARVDSELNWFGTIRGRLGYTFNNVLFYATGGFAAGGVKDRLFYSNSATVALRHDQTETGFAVGGGLEYAFSPAWSVKAEYQFISLESDRPGNLLIPTAGGLGRTSNFDHDFNTVRVGVNYHINNQYVPLK